MATPAELTEQFWKALKSDRTMMLGLDGVEDGHARPMTGQFENDHGPIWFFGGRDNALFGALSASVPHGDRAIATFTAKGHDLFATVHGQLSIDDDRATIDRLWNPFVAAWYPGGKTDPNLVLFRLDAEKAEIWQASTGMLAGIKMLFGGDPKADYAGKTAEVQLG